MNQVFANPFREWFWRGGVSGALTNSLLEGSANAHGAYIGAIPWQCAWPYVHSTTASCLRRGDLVHVPLVVPICG